MAKWNKNIVTPIEVEDIFSFYNDSRLRVLKTKELVHQQILRQW